ncbi:MAG TPA: hypothetical protein VGL77_11135 [Armatimonadota bacterium]
MPADLSVEDAAHSDQRHTGSWTSGSAGGLMLCTAQSGILLLG